MPDITYCASICHTESCERHASKAPFTKFTPWADFEPSCPDWTLTLDENIPIHDQLRRMLS